VPRRSRKQKTSEEGGEQPSTPARVSAEPSKGGGSGTSRRRSSRRGVDLDSWVERNIDEVVLRSGLDYLGLSRDRWLEVLRDILEELYGSTSSYKSAEDIAKRLVRNSDRVYPVIASRLAYVLEKPTADQLEFIVSNIGEAVLDLAPKLYRLLVEVGREDLLGVLRYKWAGTWSKLRTSILPVKCPRCGFNSVMPDLSCAVCGALLSEREVKSSVDLARRLEELARGMPCSELGSLLRYDYVLVNDLEVKPPSSNRLAVDVEVYLGREEKSLLKRIYEERCGYAATE
jgi:phage FluMu protein Com